MIIVTVKARIFTGKYFYTMDVWKLLTDYYFSLADKYHVDPFIFISIHVTATPLLLLTVWWLIRKRKRDQSILVQVLLLIILYNIANVYLVVAGKNIPLFIYALLFISTFYSAFVTWQKIKNNHNFTPLHHRMRPKYDSNMKTDVHQQTDGSTFYYPELGGRLGGLVTGFYEGKGFIKRLQKGGRLLYPVTEKGKKFFTEKGLELNTSA